MRGRNPRKPYRGHEISFDADGWWQVESPDLDSGHGRMVVVVGGLADDEDQARDFARDFVDGVVDRAANPRRLPNIVVRKPEAEKLLRKDLRGRKTDYYVLSEPKNLGGPYGSLAKAKNRLRQVEYFKRVKPGRRRNAGERDYQLQQDEGGDWWVVPANRDDPEWNLTLDEVRNLEAEHKRKKTRVLWSSDATAIREGRAQAPQARQTWGIPRRSNWTSPDEAAEYALKRWGHANYLAGAPNDQTWAEFAAFIRGTGDVGAEEAAAAIERLQGLPIDFPLRVEPIRPEHLSHFLKRDARRPNRRRKADKLVWRKTKRHEGLLAKGDYVSDELAPGIRYELRRRERWDVYLRRRDEATRVASGTDLVDAKRAAASDARDVLELAREIASMKAANPADRWDLQTVIVDKSVAPTREGAAKVAREFGKRIYTSRQTKTSWRFRQRPPGDFVKGTFRTRPIRGRGVALTYGRLKGGAKPATKRRPKRR